MDILDDEAGPDLVRLLELKGFKTADNSPPNVDVRVNVEICPRPIPVRLDSPLTDESAKKKLQQAGIHQTVINKFVKDHQRKKTAAFASN